MHHYLILSRVVLRLLSARPSSAEASMAPPLPRTPSANSSDKEEPTPTHAVLSSPNQVLSAAPMMATDDSGASGPSNSVPSTRVAPPDLPPTGDQAALPPRVRHSASPGLHRSTRGIDNPFSPRPSLQSFPRSSSMSSTDGNTFNTSAGGMARKVGRGVDPVLSQSPRLPMMGLGARDALPVMRASAAASAVGSPSHILSPTLPSHYYQHPHRAVTPSLHAGPYPLLTSQNPTSPRFGATPQLPTTSTRAAHIAGAAMAGVSDQPASELAHRAGTIPSGPQRASPPPPPDAPSPSLDTFCHDEDIPLAQGASRPCHIPRNAHDSPRHPDGSVIVNHPVSRPAGTSHSIHSLSRLPFDFPFHLQPATTSRTANGSSATQVNMQIHAQGQPFFSLSGTTNGVRRCERDVLLPRTSGEHVFAP
ncbi:hypothetical protein DL93DRAFT_921110 [Clavulina sp. PMI_390]|nr:hypothetical protein DL93DRAFT_921110 [Clavulina sp. PMI_390]